MKPLLFLLAVLIWSSIGFADEPVQVNFNLVQVNHYPSQTQIQENVVTPGKRLVIDMNESSAALSYLSASSSIPIYMRHDNAYRSQNGAGSRGCFGMGILGGTLCSSHARFFSCHLIPNRLPRHEVGPSVAVAFSNGKKWSNPPIRFGPLTDNTICPLGNGFELEVSGRGSHPPLVRVVGDNTMYGRR